jgi:glucose-6-phosphate isomerase
LYKCKWEKYSSEIYDVKKRKIQFSNEIIAGGRTDIQEVFTDIVNIGIGGSDLGPMVVEALQFYKKPHECSFCFNIDGDHVNEVIKRIQKLTLLLLFLKHLPHKRR